MTTELAAACVESAHVLTPDGLVYRDSRAAFYVVHGLGYRLLPALFWYPPMKWMADLGYRVFARHRAFFSRHLFRE